MTKDEIIEVVKTAIAESAEYGKLIYININFNYEGSTSTVNLTGKPQDPPPNPPGGGG